MERKEFLNEEWRGIEGFPSYQVSSHGRVRRVTEGRHLQAGELISQNTTEDGYKYVSIGSHVLFKVADLVACAFIGAKPKGFQTHHIDKDKSNNWLYNLAYVERRSHMSAHKRIPLTAKQIEAIKLLRSAGKSTRQIAEMSGLSTGLISNIMTGKRKVD